MTDQEHSDESSDSKGLNKTDYQNRLLNKLNCLIAVLEVAIGKITNSIDSDEDKAERLGKIKMNLENTLSICRRAIEFLRIPARPVLPDWETLW